MRTERSERVSLAFKQAAVAAAVAVAVAAADAVNASSNNNNSNNNNMNKVLPMASDTHEVYIKLVPS